jgi:hypothetical protein
MRAALMLGEVPLRVKSLPAMASEYLTNQEDKADCKLTMGRRSREYRRTVDDRNDGIVDDG